MSTQLKTYKATASGNPLAKDTVAHTAGLAVRKITLTATGAAAVTLHDGVDATKPELAALSLAAAGSVSADFPDDLPFTTACYVNVASGTVKVFIYAK